jgi:multiple sugar transport system substrate-binding protein
VATPSDRERRIRVGSRRLVLACAALAGLVAVIAAAGANTFRSDSTPEANTVRTDSTCDGKLGGSSPTYITAWFHAGGASTVETRTLREQVRAFNGSQRTVQVKLITLPVGDYAEQVAVAAARGDLPDVLDFDGPNLYNYAWSGKLKPIDSCVSQNVRRDLLPSIVRQGTYAKRLWGVGTFDSGLGLYVRPSILKKAGIRIPRDTRDAWSAAELTRILKRLRQAGYRRPLDLQLDEPNPEWYTYGFAPAVWSAGGDLIDRANYRKVDGYFNGPAAKHAFTILQQWVKGGYVDPNTRGDAFEAGRSPISWIGHWFYDRYTRAFPGDVRIVPLPDFGTGTATGSGSWQWGITASATDGDAAWDFLAFLLQPSEVVRMTRANGAIPATRSAVRLSPRFARGGAEHLYIEQLEDGTARPRPQTPAYPALSAAFAQAFHEIVIRGRPVSRVLDRAARRVHGDLRDHRYYPQPAR